MESKQTSIEWLSEELELYGNPGYCEIEWKQLDSLIQQAKEMHEQEIIEAYKKGQESTYKIT